MEDALKKESLNGFKQLCIKSSDGLELNGKLFAKNKFPRAVVIAVHGYHSGGIRDMGRFAELYLKLGFDYLIISQRAHENSKGVYITFGAKESLDVLEWIKAIRKFYDNSIPIILHGLSMGAATVIMAAGNNQIKKLKEKHNIVCCIADSPYRDILSQARYLMQDRCIISQEVNLAIFKGYIKNTSHINIKTTSPVKAAANLDIPILLFHGKWDKLIPAYNSQIIFDNVRHQNKKIVYVEGAGHVCSYVVNPDLYEFEFKNFIENVLK